MVYSSRGPAVHLHGVSMPYLVDHYTLPHGILDLNHFKDLRSMTLGQPRKPKEKQKIQNMSQMGDIHIFAQVILAMNLLHHSKQIKRFYIKP